ncbi:hypothetical protein RND71_035179 [Anisodus tanguticus]|uniref:Uncharacterized protein n=1 Tax=Anisodus tanguticus TaxID=243964 RepID=A0AAE1R541_9SOLA|nr:hypothetical protein RND71_035179 [Anisodus tanguticus]
MIIDTKKSDGRVQIQKQDQEETNTTSATTKKLDDGISGYGFSHGGNGYNGGFSEMKREGKNVFDLGEKAYWLTVMFNVVTWQYCFMGTAGMVFLTGGVCMTALMAVNVLGGVIVYGDNFGGIKVVSTLLCVWGFSSYLYGMYKKMEEEKKKKESSIEKLINSDDDHQQEQQEFVEMTEIVTPNA